MVESSFTGAQGSQVVSMCHSVTQTWLRGQRAAGSPDATRQSMCSWGLSCGHKCLWALCSFATFECRLDTQWCMIRHCCIFRRQQITRNLAKDDLFLEVELAHIAQYDAILQDCLLQSPNEYLPVVRARRQTVLKHFATPPPLRSSKRPHAQLSPLRAPCRDPTPARLHCRSYYGAVWA